tara:strand:- start:1173 stop:1439 length:267 start_codon:yes stop_codon:yes gene_type:complete
MGLGDSKNMGEHEGSWREYRLLILDKLETLTENQQKHEKEMQGAVGQIYKAISEIKTDLAQQKVKVGFIGTISGAITGGITALLAYLK